MSSHPSHHLSVLLPTSCLAIELPPAAYNHYFRLAMQHGKTFLTTCSSSAAQPGAYRQGVVLAQGWLGQSVCWGGRRCSTEVRVL